MSTWAAAPDRQGKFDEAIARYRQLALKPDLAEAHSNLGSAFQKQRKFDEAIACYRRAIKLKPDLAIAHHNLGVARGKRASWTRPSPAVGVCWT